MLKYYLKPAVASPSVSAVLCLGPVATFLFKNLTFSKQKCRAAQKNEFVFVSMIILVKPCAFMDFLVFASKRLRSPSQRPGARYIIVSGVRGGVTWPGH